MERHYIRKTRVSELTTALLGMLRKRTGQNEPDAAASAHGNDAPATLPSNAGMTASVLQREEIELLPLERTIDRAVLLEELEATGAVSHRPCRDRIEVVSPDGEPLTRGLSDSALRALDPFGR